MAENSFNLLEYGSDKLNSWHKKYRLCNVQTRCTFEWRLMGLCLCRFLVEKRDCICSEQGHILFLDLLLCQC